MLQHLCVQGLVLNVVRSPEWKELMGLLNNTYHPTSADTFSDKHILHKVIFDHEKQIERLCTIKNLSLVKNQ